MKFLATPPPKKRSLQPLWFWEDRCHWGVRGGGVAAGEEPPEGVGYWETSVPSSGPELRLLGQLVGWELEFAVKTPSEGGV